MRTSKYEYNIQKWLSNHLDYLTAFNLYIFILYDINNKIGVIVLKFDMLWVKRLVMLGYYTLVGYLVNNDTIAVISLGLLFTLFAFSSYVTSRQMLKTHGTLDADSLKLSKSIQGDVEIGCSLLIMLCIAMAYLSMR